MKKTSSTDKALSFFTKNIGFVGLLTVINFLLIYFILDKIQQTDMRLQKLEASTSNVLKEMNDMSKPIVEEETEPQKTN